jgi:RNA polymerase-interacting CarD/CdnL/TRCF family regulator
LLGNHTLAPKEIQVSKKPDSLDKGDWIVHSYYGIGQIKSIETKLIDKEKVRYYKVKAKNSTFFVPVNNVINERIRPISTEYRLRKAKKALRSTPQELPENHNDRKKFIKEISSDRSLDNIAEIIRDLTYRKEHEGLNDFEENTLQRLEKLFIREWAIIKDSTEDEIHERLEKIFREELITDH